MTDAMASASAPPSDGQLRITFHHINGFGNGTHYMGSLRLAAASTSTTGIKTVVACTKTTGTTCFNEAFTVTWDTGSALSVQLQSVGLFKHVKVLEEAHMAPADLKTRGCSKEFTFNDGSFVISWELLSGQPMPQALVSAPPGLALAAAPMPTAVLEPAAPLVPTEVLVPAAPLVPAEVLTPAAAPETKEPGVVLSPVPCPEGCSTTSVVLSPVPCPEGSTTNQDLALNLPTGRFVQQLVSMPWYQILEILRKKDATMLLGLLGNDGGDIRSTFTLVGFSSAINDYPDDNKFAPDPRFYSADIRDLANKINVELSSLLASKKGWSPEQIIRVQCLKAFAVAVTKGQLVHGPLLAWAKWKGDELQEQCDEFGLTYIMPVRHGVPFTQYPWSKHAVEAIMSVKKWLQEIGSWHHWEQSVAKASTEVLVSSSSWLDQNVIERNKAMLGAKRPNQVPDGTTIAVFRAEFENTS